MKIFEATIKSLLIIVIAAFCFAQLEPANPVHAQSSQRVQFAPGATQTTLNGSLAQGGNAQYVLRASAGQTMWVYTELFDWNSDFSVYVYDPNGFVMPEDVQTSGTTLEAGGDYIVYMYSSTGAEYAVTVGIENQVSQPVQPPAPVEPVHSEERINFAPGATNAATDGYLVGGSSKTYILNARAGQEMWVQADVTNNQDFGFTMIAPSGFPMGGDGSLTWEATLNESGEYAIYMHSSVDTYYTLVTSIITPEPTPVQPDPTLDLNQFERINFAPGATSATRSGSVPMNGLITYYLRAAAGQWMDASVTGLDAENVALGIYSPSGEYISINTLRTWSGTLPESGDYQVQVYSILGAFDKHFDLNVSIVTPEADPVRPPSPGQPVLHQAERINFEAGTTWATRSGSVAMNGSITYYLWASAGQWMDVSITGHEARNIGMEVYSPSGDYLFSFEPRTWNGTLPETGDYQIKVYSSLGIFDKAFNLNVSIVN